MNDANSPAPKGSVVDLVLSLIVLAVTAVAGAGFSMVSVMSVMMSDSCGTMADGGALICSSIGGGLWAGAEIFLAAGLVIVLALGLVFVIRRYIQAKAAWPIALASVGGCVAVGAVWFGLMMILAN